MSYKTVGINSITNKCSNELSDEELVFEGYSADKYKVHIQKHGLEKTWIHILNYMKENNGNRFLNVENFSEMYEFGLATLDKNDKKKTGQYYTPSDVSKLMSSWLQNLEGLNVCDVGSGTGNLILSYLGLIGVKEAVTLLKNKRIYLFDIDKVALMIAQYSIAFTYGFEYFDKINVVCGDFLSDEVILPKNSKIISNPPYAKLNGGFIFDKQTIIQRDSKELYASFLEKIIISGNPSVIITPFSFMGGSKFFSLRRLLNNYNGFIVPFDNVPGSIFNGRKHGIFNSNSANSVRAAITVVENNDIAKGFRTTHLIRFKNEERERVLDPNILKDQLSEKYQIVDTHNKMYAKYHYQLESCFMNWVTKSSETLKKFVSKHGKHTIYMPNTCRYYTVASKKKLSRGGYITIHTEDVDKFNYLYCLINSSFVYWWWRIFDGGITYPVGLLNSVPIFYGLLTEDDKIFFAKMAEEMISLENKYTITKLNANKIQENIKFPKAYRNRINIRLLEILSCSQEYSDFDLVHSNSFFD